MLLLQALSTPELRRMQRRLLAPAFGNDALSGYVNVMDGMVEDTLKDWVNSGGEFEVQEGLRCLTIDLSNGLLVGISGLDAEIKNKVLLPHQHQSCAMCLLKYAVMQPSIIQRAFRIALHYSKAPIAG